MDDRQTEIRAGAGLEDSRINKEFIDFLNKWSSPVILVFAVAALVWAGLRWMEQKKIEKIDRAFGSLHAATVGGNPSPASLNALAEEFAGVRSVSELAKLQTADLYLTAFLRGIEPGATINPATGEPVEETDTLNEAQRLVYLDKAGDLATEVITMSESDEGKVMLTMQGLIRAGAVSECRRDFDEAKGLYTRMISLAQQVGMPSLEYFGQLRLEAVDVLDPDLSLPNSEDLVALPGEEILDVPNSPAVPETDEVDSATEDGTTGSILDEEVDGQEETGQP